MPKKKKNKSSRHHSPTRKERIGEDVREEQDVSTLRKKKKKEKEKGETVTQL